MQADEAFRYFESGNLCGAAEKADASVQAGYETAELQNLRGILFSRRGSDAAAIAAYERALALNCNFVVAQCNLGISLQKIGRPEDAIACWERAIHCDPAFTDPYIALALVKIDRREFDAAESLLRRALEHDGRCSAAYANLGYLFHLRQRSGEAVEYLQHALTLDPASDVACVTLGSVFHQRGMFLRARDYFEKALAIAPHSIVAQYNLGQTLLLLGDFARGWPLYEARFAWWKQNGAVLPTFHRHRWRGEDPAGMTLLLVAEQGLGDTLHFVRYAALLAAKGSRVIVECQAPLLDLLKTVPGVSQVVSRGDVLPDYDRFCPLMSLPMLLGTSLNTIPNQLPYILPNPHLVEDWKLRINRSNKLKVGLAWRGNPRSFDYQLSQINLRRSMSLKTLKPVLNTSGVEFFNIQRDPHSQSELAAFDSTVISDFPENLKDFANTAALISNLDLVVSVDTSLAHLAGAMGKPVWLMSSHDGCWRWLIDRTDSPWYPSMRIFRQTAPDDWGHVISAIAAEIAAAPRAGASDPR